MQTFQARTDLFRPCCIQNGMQTDYKKVELIHKWPMSTNVTEVRSFLGFTNYYQRFIKKYVQIAKCLYKLISGENSAKKWNSIRWDLECQETFDKLKELCTTTPILAYADFGKPFKLHQCKCLGSGSCFISGTRWSGKKLLVTPADP